MSREIKFRASDKMKRYTFFFEIETIRALRREAKLKGFASMSALLRKIIHEYFSKK